MASTNPNTTTQQPEPQLSHYQIEKLRQHKQKTINPVDQYKPNWFTRKWRSYKALVASGPSSSDVDSGPGGVSGQIGQGVQRQALAGTAGGTNEEI
jgi:hypothetical protein